MTRATLELKWRAKKSINFFCPSWSLLHYTQHGTDLQIRVRLSNFIHTHISDWHIFTREGVSEWVSEFWVGGWVSECVSDCVCVCVCVWRGGGGFRVKTFWIYSDHITIQDIWGLLLSREVWVQYWGSPCETCEQSVSGGVSLRVLWFTHNATAVPTYSYISPWGLLRQVPLSLQCQDIQSHQTSSIIFIVNFLRVTSQSPVTVSYIFFVAVYYCKLL
jgi:hypothetical protein